MLYAPSRCRLWAGCSTHKAKGDSEQVFRLRIAENVSFLPAPLPHLPPWILVPLPSPRCQP